MFFELSATKLAMKNTFLLGALSATCGTLLALVIAYLTARARRHRPPRAGLSRHRAASPSPASCWASACSSPTRAGRVVLYGTLWILLLAYLTIELPAAYQQLQSSLPHAVTRARGGEPHPGRLAAARRCATSPRRCWAPASIATWCFIFVAVVRELSAAVILFTSETKVLSVLIFDLKESGDLAAIAVLGLTMLILTGAVIVVANRLPGFSGGIHPRNN